MLDDNGNKCGKCQNHEEEVLKKGHARDCPYKECDCSKCCLLDARSDILQVISGKETKLKGTKKDPHCGFCQNHGYKVLRKGHVRSCEYGQERHFRTDNCFDCEVHYIRNEVNRLQIKMRRAMREDRTLSAEQKKTAREAITKEEVDKVCNMARMAREKRNAVLAAQQVAGEPLMCAKAQKRQQQVALFGDMPGPSGVKVKHEHQVYAERSLLDQDGVSGSSFAQSMPMSMLLQPQQIPQPRHPLKRPHDNAPESQSDSDSGETHDKLNSCKRSRKKQKCWRPWKELMVEAQARQLINQQLQNIKAQQPRAEAGLQRINQTQPPAQLQGLDCSIQLPPFAVNQNSEPNGIPLGPPYNPFMVHAPTHSLPELQQPVDLHCAMLKADCGGRSHLQPSTSHMDLNSTCSSGSQYNFPRGSFGGGQTELDNRVVIYEMPSAANNARHEEPELDIVNSPPQSPQVNDESSVESLSPIQVMTPRLDPTPINISFISNHANNFIMNPNQDQPVALLSPEFNRQQQFLNTIHLFRLMLQFSQNNRAS